MNRPRSTIRIGGRVRDAQCYWDRINAKEKAIRDALKPKPARKLAPGEEHQLMLPGIERGKSGSKAAQKTEVKP